MCHETSTLARKTSNDDIAGKQTYAVVSKLKTDKNEYETRLYATMSSDTSRLAFIKKK